MSSQICIYHKDCSDGTAAAAIFLKKFPESKTFPLTYGYTEDEARLILGHVDKDTVVYTVDCCLLAKECVAMGNTVISIDHHISVFEEMTEFAKTNTHFTYVFDNNKSGASLAWSYFFPDEDTPQWILFVEDYDIWTEKFSQSPIFFNWTSLHINKPEDFNELFDSPSVLKAYLKKGLSIQEFNDFYLQNFVAKAKPLFLIYKDHYVPAYNSTHLANELAHTLADKSLGVAAIYTIRGEKIKLSIRSLSDSKVSALEVAESFGGGGHRKSAGCVIKTVDFSKYFVALPDST